MARRSSNNKQPTSDYNFINVDFSLEDRLDINHWLSERNLNLPDTLLEMVESGFKMSLSYDDSAELFSFTMTESKRKDRKGPLQVYYFKHTELDKGFGVFYWFFIHSLDKGSGRYNETQGDYSW